MADEKVQELILGTLAGLATPTRQKVPDPLCFITMVFAPTGEIGFVSNTDRRVLMAVLRTFLENQERTPMKEVAVIPAPMGGFGRGGKGQRHDN